LQVQFRLRKKIEGEPGDSDLRTSSTMLRGMQDGLVAIGRIQNGLGAVLPMRHNMMEHGRTLADLNDGTILGTLGNHVKAFFWDNISYTPTFTFAAANVVNFVSSRVWGGDWGGDYLRRREYMASRRPDLDNVMVSITSGNHNRAYVQMVLADPAAVDTHAARPIEAAAERLTMADRFDAVMRKARQIVAQVMETHQWTGIVADTIKWAGFMAVAAPVLSRVFLSRAIAAESAINAASSGTRNAFRLFRSEVYRGIGERLAALSPKMLERGAYYTLVKAPLTRFVRTTGMLLASEFLFGAIGGAQTVLVEHWIPKLQGKSSPFTSAWDALHRGAIGSAQWLTQSWHPLILFVNIPYTAYGGTRFGEFAQKFASNGLGSYTAGLLTPTTPSKTLAGLFAKITGSATTKAVWERRLAMETMLSPGTAWYVRMPLGLLVMADHLAKFHYFSEFMGYLGTHIGYWARTAPVSEETKQAVRARTEWMPGWMQSVVRWPFGLHVQDEGMRTRYALSDGQAWKEAPLWALLPMHPAQGRSAQQYRMGEKYFDWIARNGTAAEKIRIINMTALESQGAEKVVPTDRRARKHVGRQGWQEWLQEGRLDSRLMDEGFTPSEAQQAAILRRGDFLMSEITALKGKSANSLPAMLRILLETPDGKLVGEGGIKMGKVVREVLRERIIQEMEGKPDGVKDILLHKEKFHPGLGIQIDGATAMLLSRLVRLAEQDGSRKFAAVKELVDKNLANVDAKMDAVANAAIAMEKAFFALRHDPSEPFLDAMRETRKVMERLERAQEDKDPAKREHYLDAHEEIRKIQDDAIKSGKLRAEEAEALKHPTRYMDAIEELYNAENNAAGAGARIADGRNIIANEVEGRAAPGAAKEMVQAFHQAIGELTDAHMNGPVKAHPKGRVSSSRFNDAYENDLEYHPKPQKGKSNHPLIDKDGPS
ncbi:MAG TPA: hypothetical protein VNI01_13650, partial [Elusimicrobiota bacterium]|nr:hypothetical protein [Elusimicrobiota bacterium]